MRTIVLLAALLAILLSAPQLAHAEQETPTGLLWKQKHDGLLNGWTATPGARVDSFIGLGSSGVLIWARGAEYVRSTMFPTGTREVIMTVERVPSALPGSIEARGTSGQILLNLTYSNSGLCVRDACQAGMDQWNHDISIRSTPTGWVVKLDGSVVASGSDAPGAIDHLTVRGNLLVYDLRTYGDGPFVDESFRASHGAFTPIIEPPNPVLAAPYEKRERALLMEPNELDLRVLMTAPAPAGAWVYQNEVSVRGWELVPPSPSGYAILAGLDETGETLWRIGIADASRGPLFPHEPWRLTLGQADSVVNIAPIPSTAATEGHWSGWFVAHGEPATGMLTIRIEGKLIRITIPTLDETTQIAFGDADRMPRTNDVDLTTENGAARVEHFTALLAPVASNFEV